MNPIKTRCFAPTLAVACLTLGACGGSSSDSGMLIEGTLTQAETVSHSNSAFLKHGGGQRIENVEICALGECSTTDSEGQWGFVADHSFMGGEVALSIQGHGIDTVTVVDIHDGAQMVFIDLQHHEDGQVMADHVTVDGETSHHEDEEHTHE